MKIEPLYDSRGCHIANLVNDQLHSPEGPNIGHYLRPQKIFIDMEGRYLGEIFEGNRLITNQQSPHRYTNYGLYGNYGNIGPYGHQGFVGPIFLPPGWVDVDRVQLAQVMPM